MQKERTVICQFPNFGTQNSEVSQTENHGEIQKHYHLPAGTNESTKSNNSADDKWANLAVAHGAGDLIGHYQAGGHPAGEHRPHHVHDANRDSPRHRHPCSSTAATKEAIPRTPSFLSCRCRQHSARKNRNKLRLAPVLVPIDPSLPPNPRFALPTPVWPATKAGNLQQDQDRTETTFVIAVAPRTSTNPPLNDQLQSHHLHNGFFNQRDNFF